MSSPTKRGKRAPESRLGALAVAAIVLLLAVYALVLVAARPNVDGDRLRLDAFVSLAEVDRIRSAEILDQDAYVVGRYERRDGSIAKYNLPFLRQVSSRDRLVGLVLENRIPSRVNQQLLKSLVEPVTVLLPALILIVVFVYFILSFRRGTGLFSTGGSGRRIEPEDAVVRFADVAGQDAAIAELREIADCLADPERYAELGGQVPRGVLLFGPPGCGKTLLARALAGEAGAAFYSVSGSEFVEMYVGVGAARVRELFATARLDAPAIIFIDEIDAVGARRTGSGAAAANAEEQSQALNQLLAEIDGFSSTESVMVVAATNRPDVLDPALLRPGRFDRAVGLSLPDEANRRSILAIHARSKALGGDVDLDAVAHKAVGMSGADLAGVMNEAALLSARARHAVISQATLLTALERLREAPERRRRLSMRDRRIGQTLLDQDRVTFADIAGVDAAVAELAEIREYLADPARFERLGARIPAGYLLTGPPGTGKTLLARAVAGEANAGFVSVAATEFVEVLLGEGAARVRDLFAEVRGLAPAILFIDEIDAIGGRRGASLNDSSESAQTLNQLLIELDGFGPREGVVVLAATNRPELLDPALTRQGRLDRLIDIDLPDQASREAILALHGKNMRLAEDVDLRNIARLSRGMSGADLSGLLNEAALLAARRGADAVTRDDLDEGFDRVLSGIGGSRELSEEDRLRVAYHEAGHGMVARALPGGRLLHKISIIPRGSRLGVSWLPDSEDNLVKPKAMLVERMATLLGGLVCEQVIFGEHSSGAVNDLERVGAIARHMVVDLGMSEAVGTIGYGEDGSPRTPWSEHTARLIDEEIRRFVGEARELAREVLVAGRPALGVVVEALLERETLGVEEIDELVGPPPARSTASARP
ncbi:MAG: AAA family ATPase [Actinomycetota bacterium]|nr:AAA family ATPase [Actinomycetota bacterium]